MIKLKNKKGKIVMVLKDHMEEPECENCTCDNKDREKCKTQKEEDNPNE